MFRKRNDKPKRKHCTFALCTSIIAPTFINVKGLFKLNAQSYMKTFLNRDDVNFSVA